MDIEDFIERYPFLSDMTSAYKEFNRTVNEEERYLISAFLDKLQNVGDYNVKHKDIYENIMRNFWLFRNKYQKKSNIYCTYLFQWLDIIKKKHVVSDYMIGIIYGVYAENFVPPVEKNHCPYFSYDKMYKEPIDIIKIKNFYDNIQIINRILREKSNMQELDSQYCYAQRYASECAKIYRNMHNTFCSNNKHSIPGNENTCSELRAFSTSYTEYLYKIEDIKNQIPDLSDSENEKHFGCSVVESTQTPRQEHTQESGQALGMRTESSREQGSISDGVAQSDNPIRFNTTSVVSAMAGIPPFLALIYKFTPVGTMFRSKNKKSINAFNHLDEEIEKELFYRGLENGTIKSSPATYNVAYEPV
ncbi:unnamed protein product [Plasmodium vivax]|uniref:(malaria parasite P. vivax) hypothetical protein n=1 Tax=Plasmodium vivax TaxID=5855 RepID=A0A8S4H5A4_PLAVI|nr:unnamed protein product [Plasmodium vivax]